MRIHRLVEHKQKRLGQGHGSGRGKTAGRGTKGQKARGTVRIGFEGGQLPMYKRLPFVRGKKKLVSLQPPVVPIQVALLDQIDSSIDITLESLKKANLIDSRVRRAKIIGNAPVTKKHMIHLPCSKQAKASIEKAGGSVVA